MLDKLLGEGIFSSLLEITVLLVLVYLVLTKSKQFATVMGALTTGYTNSVKTLQGNG